MPNAIKFAVLGFVLAGVAIVILFAARMASPTVDTAPSEGALVSTAMPFTETHPGRTMLILLEGVHLEGDSCQLMAIKLPEGEQHLAAKQAEGCDTENGLEVALPTKDALSFVHHFRRLSRAGMTYTFAVHDETTPYPTLVIDKKKVDV